MIKDILTSPSPNWHLSPGLDITPAEETVVHFRAAVRNLPA